MSKSEDDPKLPKDLLADPRHDAVVARLKQNTYPIWEESQRFIPTIPLTPALASELRNAIGLDLVFQGLEQIDRQLGLEKRGIDAVAAKNPGQMQSARISRILFVANDGAERFYRECDTLLYRYSDRLMACRIDASGDEIGLALYGAPKLVRALLVADKKATSRVLLTLA